MKTVYFIILVNGVDNGKGHESAGMGCAWEISVSFSQSYGKPKMTLKNVSIFKNVYLMHLKMQLTKEIGNDFL